MDVGGRSEGLAGPARGRRWRRAADPRRPARHLGFPLAHEEGVVGGGGVAYGGP